MAFRIERKKDRAAEAREIPPQSVVAATAVMPTTAAKGGETVRISFRMGLGLHRRLKLEAVRQGRTIVAMLEGFVAEHTPAA